MVSRRFWRSGGVERQFEVDILHTSTFGAPRDTDSFEDIEQQRDFSFGQ